MADYLLVFGTIPAAQLHEVRNQMKSQGFAPDSFFLTGTKGEHILAAAESCHKGDSGEDERLAIQDAISSLLPGSSTFDEVKAWVAPEAIALGLDGGLFANTKIADALCNVPIGCYVRAATNTLEPV